MYIYPGKTSSPIATAFGEGQNGSSCSGWERDRDSFSKRVAEHYMRTVFGQSLNARSIHQASPVRWEVQFPNNIVVGVVFAKDFVAASRLYANPSGPVRHYNYSCTATGDLVLSERKLPS
jgi:hypothetical protein